MIEQATADQQMLDQMSIRERAALRAQARVAHTPDDTIVIR